MTILSYNLKRLIRDKSNLMSMLIIPIFFITLTMLNSSTTGTINVGIVNNDNTSFTSNLVNNLKENCKVISLQEKDIKQKLINSDIDYAIIIDKDFTDKIINMENVKIRTCEIKNSNISMPIKSYINNYINMAKNIGLAANRDIAKFYKGLKLCKEGSLSSQYKFIENTDGTRKATYKSLGFLVMSILMYSMNASSLIEEDKRNKTLFRVIMSPISEKRYAFENILSFFIVSVIQILCIFSIMIFIFKADFGPSIIKLIILYIIFSMVCVSLSIAISAVSRNGKNASLLSNIITIPICMIGGCFWPREIMPAILIKISNFVPTTWILKASDKILYSESLTSVSTEVLILFLFMVIFLLVGGKQKTIQD